MKTPVKLFTSGASLFCAAVLGLQAQSTATSAQSETVAEKGSKASSTDLRTTPSTDRRAQGAHDSSAHPTQPGSAAKSSQSGAASTTPSSSTSSTASADPSSSSAETKSGSYGSTDSAAASVSGSASGSASGSYGASRTETSSSSSDASIRANAAGQSTNVAGSQIDAPSTSSTTESSVATSTQTDTQVTTIVQQIDAQGPVVVERITTQFADVACSPENARQLVEALHGGTAVTLSADGKTATFTPTSKLGYGEAYLTLALAAEALRSAGITGCATPEQWQAVLMGGPLVAAGTTSTATTRTASASSSSNFPGILALRSQGKGWGQIAQATNVQLGQVMSSARSSLKIDASGDSALSPTGRTSAEMQQSRMKSGASGIDSETSKGAVPGHSPDRSSGKGHDKDKDKDKNEGKHQPDARSTGAESASPNR